MSLTFTEFVRLLAEEKEPTSKDLDAVLSKLKAALKGKMAERSLLHVPPRRLGVYGASSWSDENAFEQLLYDCFSFSFVHRLSSLQGLLKMQSDIEGVIFRNIGNFLFERQKKHDPVGYRTFQMLQSAIRESMDAKELYVLSGDSRIRNATVLGFSPDADSSPEPQEVALAEATRAWRAELLPGLVTARGKEKADVVGRLRRHLLGLRDQGFESFEFKDLISPLKQAVRQWWHALSRPPKDEMGFADDEDVQLVRPDSTLEDAQALDQLAACVEDAIDHWGNRVKTRSDLRKLWLFLKALASEDAPRPSNRKIGEALDIPRSSLPKLFSIIRQLVETCRMSKG